MNQVKENQYDGVIVGAGLAGLFMLYRLREMGFKVRVFEADRDLGGTWFQNRYPGVRCDVPSFEYSYQFSEQLQLEWSWSEKYASGAEILKYINYVADKFNLRSDIQFNSRIEKAAFNDLTNSWKIEIKNGEEITARFLILATGPLSTPNIPNFQGLDTFKGSVYHTAKWPETEVNFEGQTVGVIGTGSSAVQSIPLIANQAKHLFVFQRTPAYVVPACNQPITPSLEQEIKTHYPEFRARNNRMPSALYIDYNDRTAMEVSPQARQSEYQNRWNQGGFNYLGAFNDLMTNAEANHTAAEFIRSQIRQIVKDPKVAQLLSPDYVLGCKRMCLDTTNYYETFNRNNVTLVDVKSSPIQAINSDGVQLSNHKYVLDSLILATGFDAITGALLKIDIRGKQGVSLREHWKMGPSSYLGLSINNFPNLFTICGPFCPAALTNVLPSIEQHVNWIADCLKYLKENNFIAIEATEIAEKSWVDLVKEIAEGTLFTTCNSWYVGANIPGKARVFTTYIGFPAYVDQCNEIAHNDYQGFKLLRK